MLPVLQLVAALPEHGEAYELCTSSDEFTSKTNSLGKRIESLLHTFTGNPTPLTSATEEAAYELCAKLRESAHTSSDNSKGLSSLKEKVKITSTATTTTTTTTTTRPQDLFLDKPDNSRTTRFLPSVKLTNKPFATRQSLEESLAMQISPKLPDNLAQHLQLAENVATEYYRNPYEEEIQHAAKALVPQWLFSKEEQTVDCPLRVREKAQHRKRNNSKNGNSKQDSLESIPLYYVENIAMLEDMAQHLNEQRVIAVDLEHHSQHSFLGFSCLMQISSKERDYIVDLIKLRSEVGDALRGVFANPAIVKVLHGSDSDVMWLQRDFALYVVQMFDTGQAARVLNYPSASLAFALDRHCRVTANKALQLADWRQRPLSREMLLYAREDTHFLLGVFDVMRRELLKLENGLEYVVEKSADIASKAYEKPAFTAQTYVDLVSNDSTLEEIEVLKRLVDWRDSRARALDESWEFLLPNRGVKRLAKVAPQTVLELVRELDSLNASPYVRANVEELLVVIKQQPQEVAVQEPETRKRTKLASVVKQQIEQAAPIPLKDDHCFYIGVNGEHAMVTLETQQQAISPPAADKQREIIVKAKRSDLFARNTESFFNVDRVDALTAKLMEKEQEDMRNRMLSVERVAEVVEDLLKDLPFAPSPPKFTPTQSVVQAFGHKSMSLMPNNNNNSKMEEEEDSAAAAAAPVERYEFTHDKAVAAGVIKPKEEPKPKKLGKNDKPKREELIPDDKSVPQRRNPYMLKPGRAAAKSTSYVPKN